MLPLVSAARNMAGFGHMTNVFGVCSRLRPVASGSAAVIAECRSGGCGRSWWRGAARLEIGPADHA
jgi:hypothetical protein